MSKQTLGNGTSLYYAKVYFKSSQEMEIVKVRARILGLSVSTFLRDLVIRDVKSVSTLSKGEEVFYNPLSSSLDPPTLPPDFDPSKPFFTPEEFKQEKEKELLLLEEEEEKILRMLNGSPS